jgi:hypothetical protein
MFMQRSIPLLVVSSVWALFFIGCGPGKPGGAASGGGVDGAVTPHIIQGVTINEPLILSDPPLPMTAARNETASTILQLTNLPKPREKSVMTLRVQPLQLATENAQIDVNQIKAYQILPMPVDANRAGFVRHTGQKASSRTMPKALLPVAMEGGKINVTALRDPSEPFKPNSRLGLSDQPALLWFDVRVPPIAKPGQYTTSVDLIRDGERVESVPLSLTVYDFVLPEERHLQMVGRIEWESLEALYPDLFETITPQLMSRNDPKYAQAVRLLDQLEALAHEHRTTVVVPRLQPVVKWPANAAPQVDWTDFDSITEPWLSGSGFEDKIPVGFWPLPRTEYLDRYPTALRMQYWMSAAFHFDQQGWMDRSWVEVEKDTPGRASAAECVELSSRVAEILQAHPRLRVSLPLEDAQLQFRVPGDPKLIDKNSTDRLMTAASGLVFAPPNQPWPTGVKRPAHWLRTDLPGLVPYIGAGGDERDVRLWAWLAFLRQAQVIGWDGALPHSQTPDEAADPNDLTWFYPGEWFGVDQPVPTIQLKWLRRAQQDYEYLYLAKQRGQVIYSLVMARLMIKPVQTQPNEYPDPTHGLLTGTTDPSAWTKALELLAKNILLRAPGQPIDQQKETEINIETMNWIAPQDKPLLIARNTQWGWAARPGNWVDLRLGLDIYNASDQPMTGALRWESAPHGWEFNPQPSVITLDNAINVFQVKQFAMDARVDLDKLGPQTRQPLDLAFAADAKPTRPSHVSVLAPVALCDKREGRLSIDGALGDWDDAADSIQQGPMVVMLDRPNLQRQALQMASTPSAVYSNWAAKNFYVAFKLQGLSGEEAKMGKNEVDYQLRRAWGEDLCEILMQPVYKEPGNVGQIVHLVVKPNGQIAAAIKPSPKNQRLFGSAYKAVLGASVRYGYAVEGGIWRGELAIPLDLINDKDHQGMKPTLMRFNFAQHKRTTGESSSWAGPVDFGRDDSFMGLLYLRDLKSPGMGGRE